MNPLWLVFALASPPRPALEAALGEIDRAPTREDLARLGPDVPRALVEIARDARASLFARVRALGALGMFPSREARETLRAAVRGAEAGRPGEDVLVLRAALAALVEGFGDVEAARPFLAHGNADVRIAAALALSRRALGAAILQARLAGEPDARVRAAIERGLRKLAPAPAR